MEIRKNLATERDYWETEELIRRENEEYIKRKDAEIAQTIADNRKMFKLLNQERARKDLAHAVQMVENTNPDEL